MDIPNIENQNFSEKTLKGFLLKNVDPTTQNPTITELNNYLVARVDLFWEDVVVPLRNLNNFNGNKINWYFEVYREGHEARKLNQTPFTFINVDEEAVRKLIAFYDGKTLREYIELGTSFLANSYTMLTAWMRDQMVLKRLQRIYNSENPHEWILRAEEEEHGVMKEKMTDVEGLIDVVNNIGLIMSRKV